MSSDKKLREAILNASKSINDSEALLIVAGAGMGIDSGLPDYRGPNGLWNTWHPWNLCILWNACNPWIR